MSEIDVSKCDYSDMGTCFDHEYNEIEYVFCNLFDEPCSEIRKRKRCFYTLKKQLQQLKQENEELKQGQIHFENKWAQTEDKLKKIKEICEYDVQQQGYATDAIDKVLQIIESRV